MISDEAVEAAAKAVYLERLNNIVVAWTREEWLAVAERDARAALEAAAPHLLAPVLEVADRLASTDLTGDNYHRGRASGFRMAAEHIRQATNPYRKARHEQ